MKDVVNNRMLNLKYGKLLRMNAEPKSKWYHLFASNQVKSLEIKPVLKFDIL